MLTNSASWGTIVTALVGTDRQERVEWSRMTPLEGSSPAQGLSLRGGPTRKFMLGVLDLSFCLLLASSSSAHADAITDWNANASKAAIICPSPTGDPFHESRMYAMTHIAIHDALNAIDRRSQPYALNLPATPGASVEAAVATAVRDVLVPLLGQLPMDVFSACIPPAVSSVEADYTAENGFARILVGYHFRKAVEEGIKHGRKIGKRAVDQFLKPVD